MDESTFWSLVETARAESAGAQPNQAERLRAMLEGLPPEEILEFERLFVRFHHQAYRWDLWAAAELIEGGCSDDGFSDFRAGLIALGREAYDKALAAPGSLALHADEGGGIAVEEMLYVSGQAYEAVTGESLPELGISHPRAPSGERLDVATARARYPELDRSPRRH